MLYKNVVVAYEISQFGSYNIYMCNALQYVVSFFFILFSETAYLDLVVNQLSKIIFHAR